VKIVSRGSAATFPAFVLLLGLIGVFQDCHLAAAPVPPTDNTSEPYMGIYDWGLSTPANQTHIAYSTAWLGRTNSLWAVDFEAFDSWANISGPAWQMTPCQNWLSAHPGAKLILTLPMLPCDPNNTHNPLPGTSLALGAAGNYNNYFKTLATTLVNRKLADGSSMADHTVLRPGHEFNGDWYPWKAVNQAGALNFAAYWRQIYATMKAVPGTGNLKFCWNVATNWTSYYVTDAYPGDGYVDYVGVDVYDYSGYYPYPANATAAEIAACQANAWNYDYASQYNNGLVKWSNFANSHGKPLAIPEWGSTVKYNNGVLESPQHGGLDNTYFIQKMYNFIQEPANNVAFHAYFDVQAGDGHHQLTPYNGFTTQFPNAAALFRQLFNCGRYECENLATTPSGATEADFTDVSCSGGAGNKLSADGVNDYVQYDVDLPSGGTWNISLKVKKYSSRGKFKLYLPQANAYIGTEQDQYAAAASYTILSLGSYTFSSGGVKQFRFIVTGKNAASSGYDLGNDVLILSK
jgi:hypothetical protein